MSQYSRHYTGISTLTPSPDYVYFNTIVANSNSGSTGPIPFDYKEERVQAIIDKPADYVVAVQSFRLPTANIPLLVITGGSRNLGTVTIYQTSGTSVSKDVIVTPDFITDPPGLTSVTKVVIAVNEAMRTAWGQVVATTLNPNSTVPPVMTFDQNAQLFSVFLEQGVWIPNVTPTFVLNGLALVFSQQLYALFVISGSLDPLGNGVIVSSSNLGTNSFVSAGPPYGIGGGLQAGAYWKMTQTTSSLDNWSDFQSIVVTTGSIPIVAELLPGYDPASSTPGQYVTDGTSSNPGLQNTRSILSDWQFQHDSANDQGPGFNPTPAVFQATLGKQRWISMTGTTPLTAITLSVYWQSKALTLYPLTIPLLDYAYIKLVFKHKSVKD